MPSSDHAAYSIPGLKQIPNKTIVGYADPKPERGTIKLTTKDGRVVHRYLDKMSEDVKPPDDPIGFFVHQPTEAEDRQHLDELCEKMNGTDLVEQYRSNHRKEWKPDPSTGYTSMPVLPQFWGKKLDNSLVAYLHTLRPSSVRISDGCVTCDSSPWRVTVFTDKKDGVEIITNISQEVCIGFSSGWNVQQVFNHLHEGRPKPGPFPRVVGNLSALSRADFK